MADIEKSSKTPVKQPSQLHKSIIDEWYKNGYNKVKAVLAIKPDMAYAGANTVGQSVFKHIDNQAYIKLLQTEAAAQSNINSAQIRSELITFAYSDVTDYIDLTPSELKALPPEQRRCIASFTKKKKSFTTRQGDYHEEETYTIKLIDKTKAIDMLNKHLGFYSEDNSQKQPRIDLSNMSIDNLNVLLQITDGAKLTG